MKYQKVIQELRAAVREASSLQLAIALEAAAYVHAESYMEHNPLPQGATAVEREEMRAAMIFHTMTRALNMAAEVVIDLSEKAAAPQSSAEDQARASATADAAIAKAAGKLH